MRILCEDDYLSANETRPQERVATTNEVVAALSLSEKDTRRIKRAYASKLNTAVAKILAQLYERKIIFSPGGISSTRYYGSVKALSPEDRSLPSITTRRRRVLQLVNEAVIALGRPVRTGDVLNYVKHHSENFDISPELITRDILNLKATGELRLVGSTLRRDNGGGNYYFPRDLDPNEFAAKQPLTWLEEVANSFKTLWENRMQQAVASNRLPRPVSAAEVRDYMMALPHPHPNLLKQMFLVNALIQLSETDSPVVRKVRRPRQRAVLWAPCDVPDDEIDIGDLFINDTERVGEAVARAVRYLGRPVNVKEVRAEVKLDPTLQPAGTARLSCVISDASKEQTKCRHKEAITRPSRKHPRVFRAGRIGNDTYYYHSPNGLDDAKFFVQVEHIKHHWNICSAVEQMTALAGCTYPSIVLGRALMVQSDVKRTKFSLERLLKTSHGTAEVREQAKSLLEQVRDIALQNQLWLKDKSCLTLKFPSEINPMPQTWTAAELLAFLKPLYPLAQEITDPNKLIRLVFRCIRRIPNPNFRYRFDQKPDEAAEYFFDKTDALLYAAQKWGGYECCFQAALAKSNLGLLRDERFVFPLLEMDRFDDRLAGVACLAFLQTPEAIERLKAVAVQDNNSIVREPALWAVGFAGDERVPDLFLVSSKRDSDPRVRAFAEGAIKRDKLSWWMS